MGYKPTPWSERIFELLKEREPRTRQELFDATVGLVPPGRAFRQAERNRQYVRKHWNWKKRPDRQVNDKRVLVGARHIVSMSLLQFIRSGRLRREGELIYLGREAEYNIEKIRRWWDAASPEERKDAIDRRVAAKKEAARVRRTDSGG